MDVVAHEAELSRPTKDGASARAYVEAAAKRGNADAIAKLSGPAFPESVRYLYEWFGELSASRSEGMHGPAPITHLGIKAWADLTDQHPQPHEVKGLLMLDAAWRLAAMQED